MSRTSYSIYKEQCFALARSMIVKHEEVAISSNYELQQYGYYDPVLDASPYDWRYYKNLAGEYHRYDTDFLLNKYGTPTMMVTIPSDTGTVEVPFVKDLINGDNAVIAIANEFSIGSRLYKEMVDKYPELEQLIIGILNPIEPEIALKAKNGEILYIDGLYKSFNQDGLGVFGPRGFRAYNRLIEKQETNLIEKLQEYIYNYYDHWVNQEYVYGHDLYTVGVLTVLYSSIPNYIMNIRLGNCKTPYVHSFHVTEYLESFGQLGKHVPFIPFQSALWLYRNLTWLEANRGKQRTFHSIIDNMWTPNEIPMSAYSLKHKTHGMDHDNPLPTGFMYKEPINLKQIGASDDDRTIREILDDQVPLAKSNHLDLDEKEAIIKEIVNWGGDDRLNTKVLETEMFNMGEPFPFTLEQMLFNFWGYTALKGMYTGVLYFTHPLSGDRMGITPLNAYILALYCLNIAVADVKLERLPEITFRDIPRTNNPEEYPTDPLMFPKPDVDKAMSWSNNKKTRRQKVIEVLGTHQPRFKNVGPEMFHEAGVAIYQERVRKYHAYCNTEELEERGDLHLIADRNYWHNFTEKLEDIDYPSWLKRTGISLRDFTRDDYLKLGMELVAVATGIENHESMRKKWMQRSMVSILKHFISYTVHIIEKFSEGLVAYLDGQILRYSNWEIKPHDLDVRYDARIEYLAKAKHLIRVEFNLNKLIHTSEMRTHGTICFPYELDALSVNRLKEHHYVGMYNANIDYVYAGHTVRMYDPLPEYPTELVYDLPNVIVDINAPTVTDEEEVKFGIISITGGLSDSGNDPLPDSPAETKPAEYHAVLDTEDNTLSSEEEIGFGIRVDNNTIGEFEPVGFTPLPDAPTEQTPREDHVLLDTHSPTLNSEEEIAFGASLKGSFQRGESNGLTDFIYMSEPENVEMWLEKITIRESFVVPAVNRKNPTSTGVSDWINARVGDTTMGLEQIRITESYIVPASNRKNPPLPVRTSDWINMRVGETTMGLSKTTISDNAIIIES